MPEPEPHDDVEGIDEHAPRERLALIVAALGVVVLALVAVCIVQFISGSRLEQRLADADARLDEAARRARQDAVVITTLTDGLKAAQDLCDKLQQATGRLQAELDRVRDDSSRQRAAAEKTISDLTSANARLQKHVAALQKQVDDLYAQLRSPPPPVNKKPYTVRVFVPDNYEFIPPKRRTFPTGW